METILTVNAGSSSIKFELFTIEGGRPRRSIRGELSGIGSHPHLSVRDRDGRVLADRTWPAAQVGDVHAAQDLIGGWLDEHQDRPPRAVGHRVVHGGAFFAGPVLIDDAVLGRLEQLVPLAPLHQPNNLAPIISIRRRRPDLPQIACFDTAFHRGHDEIIDRFAIPRALYDEGVRRYGFHGLSYEFIARRLREAAPALAAGRTIVAHLGNGASMCALRAGRSVDTTMGFTALDGLPMGTRPGALDPGVVLYLLAQKHMDAAAIEHLLYHESGLKGLSGISSDMRDLLASTAPQARLAVSYFAHHAAQATAALVASLGGIDGFVFTAGIGEHAAPVRAAIAERLAWLGMVLDPAANVAHGPRISAAASSIEVLVIPTDEELMIAEHTLDVLGGIGQTSSPSSTSAANPAAMQ